MTVLAPVAISPVEDIVADMRAGRIVILVDEEDRENEGDLVLAADHVTADAINFMARFGRGLICLTLTRERCERLQLPPMTVRDRSAADIPVVTPSAASMDTVKAVPFLSPLRTVMGGSCRRSQRSRVRVRQIRPRPKRAMKLTASAR